MRSGNVVRMRRLVIPLQRARALSVRQRRRRRRAEAIERFGTGLRGGVFGHAYRVDWLLLCNTLFNGTLYLDGCQGYAYGRRKAVSAGRGTLRPICVVGKRNVDGNGGGKNHDRLDYGVDGIRLAQRCDFLGARWRRPTASKEKM
ncbi:hypothetical protein Zmor_016485 [Zophobas morio]|uniref:Uncharacterized protein n=1 Tax=Zophobas morio TaxID=2755281 RepID=A0AA38I9W8_9CUCU|nr:hypothetical protein Zmor_016485 [Zophobas morio]